MYLKGDSMMRRQRWCHSHHFVRAEVADSVHRVSASGAVHAFSVVLSVIGGDHSRFMEEPLLLPRSCFRKYSLDLALNGQASLVE